MKISKVYLLVISILVSIGVSYLNYLRYESFKIQYIIIQDEKAGDYSKDMDFINSIKTEYPSLGLFTGPLSSYKANYLLSKDSIALAIKYHEKGIESNPFLMYSEGQLADLYYSVGDFKKFEFYTRRAFKNLPNNPLHFVYLVKLLKGQNKMDSILHYYNKVEGIIGPKDVQVYNIVLASMNLNKDTILKYNGEEIAKKALRTFPINHIHHPKARLMHDYILYGKDNLEKAAENHRKGGEKFKEGDYNEAITLLKESIDLHPNVKVYYENYISANFNAKKYDEIIRVYPIYKDYFTEIQPKFIFYIGSSLYNMNKIEESCQLLIQLKNSNALSFNNSLYPKCF
tara:strand:+ start:373 stop:1401 length:1029 start_codon:yes stop_codon:yes gene_type:complete